MELKSGLPYSLIRYGLVDNYPKLSKNIRADVLIIGGGIAGALMGWKLAEKNIDAVVIDARSIGLGSTCASSSLLLYEIDTPLYKLQQQYGEKNANTTYAFSRDAIPHLKGVAKRIGFKDIHDRESIYYAASPGDMGILKKEFTARKKMGFEVDFLENQQLENETGIKASAAIISRLAAETDAYLFTHALHAASSKKGLKIYDRTKAIYVEHQKNGECIHLENGFQIRAKNIIYATGYETINYINKPLVKIRSTYATISESFPESETFWKNQRLVWNTADPYLYIRTTPDQRIMVGGRDENIYSPEKRNKLIRMKARQLAGDFKRLVPGYDFVSEFSWTGSFGFTSDGLPYIGAWKKWPNSYFALGFGGNGITFSMIAAEIIAGLLTGKKIKGAEVFSFERK